MCCTIHKEHDLIHFTPRPAYLGLRRKTAAPEREVTLPVREEAFASAADLRSMPEVEAVAAHRKGVVAETV